jgi:hypothetical protein
VSSGNLGVVPRFGEEVAPVYDVYERVVRYVLPPGALLEPRALYSVSLPIATADDGFGFRAFDGAALEGNEPIRISFFTGTELSPEPPPSPPELDCTATFCVSFGGVEPGCELPLTGGCASGGCHDDRPDQAAMGLSLASIEGFERTALAKVAHGAETGPTTGAASVASLRFGTAMPLIDPGRPENSYLLYKLLLAPEAYEPNDDGEDPCTGTRHLAPVDPNLCFSPSSAELQRLGDWFVQGEAMPAVEPSFVRRREIRALQDFIARGASCRE